MRVIGLAGWSGAGKTTLIARLLPVLAADGLRVSTVKQAHHGFDVDRPGKDSWTHRQAGAVQVAVSSPLRWALLTELRDAPGLTLPELLGHLDPVDLVLVEGFKAEAHPKIEVFRGANGKPPLHPGDEAVVAVASDTPFPSAGRPVVALDDVAAIAAIVRERAAAPAAIPWRGVRHVKPVTDGGSPA